MVTLLIPADLKTITDESLKTIADEHILISSDTSGTITVASDTDPDDKTKGISNYQIDFLINYFDALFDKQIQKDPDVIFNEYFQDFMQWIAELKRVVTESRASPTQEAIPPIQTKHTSPEKFACPKIDKHKWLPSLPAELAALIKAKTLDPLIYKDQAELQALGLPSNYWDSCRRKEIKHLFFDVIAPTIQSYDSYTTSLAASTETSSSTSPAITAFRNRIDFTLSEINDYISNGDYDTRYRLIRENFTGTAEYIGYIISILGTELNIIEHGVNREIYIDRPKFYDSDIDPQALDIPKDKDDLVSRADITADLNKAIASYADTTGSNVIASTYSIAPSQGRIVNVSALTKSLLGSLSSSGNITNPQQSLLNLMQTKIYKDSQGVKKAEYLTPDKQLDLTKELRAAQNKYIGLINTDKEVKDAAGEAGYSRMYRYDRAYPGETVKVGGAKTRAAKPPSYYDYYMQTGPTVTTTQSGGEDIKIASLSAENDVTQKGTAELVKAINTIDQNYQQRKTEYFDSAAVTIANLEQRNDYFVSMMNSMILHMFVVKDQVDRSSTFLTKLTSLSDKIDTVLKDMWDDDMARLKPAVNSALLLKYTSGASTTVSEITELFTSIGLDPSYAKPISTDPVTNIPGPHNLLSAYAREFGAGNIALIASSLRNVFRATKPIFKTGLTKDQLQKRLTTYSNSLRTLTSSLESEYANTETTFKNMATYRNLIGSNIESNLKAANSYITEMLAVLEDFSTKTDFIEDISSSMSITKNRFTDFEIFVKESRAKLEALQGRLTSTHDALFADKAASIVNHSMVPPTTLYKQATDGFVIPLATASGNAIKYFSYDREAKNLQNLDQIFINSGTDFRAIASMVYGNWTAYTDDPETVIPKERLMTLLLAPQETKRTIGFMSAYADSWMPFFPDLVEKLDIPPQIMILIDQFMSPIPIQLEIISKRRLGFDAQTNSFTSGRLTGPVAYKLADQLAVGALKYVKLAQTYPNQNKVHKVDGDNYDTVNARITTLRNALASKQTDQSMAELLAYLNKLSGGAIDLGALQSELEQYIDQVRDDLGLDEKADNSRYQVMIDRSIVSALTLFDTLNRERHQMFMSMALINNAGNPKLLDIQRAQTKAVEQSKSMDLLRLLPAYKNLNNIPWEMLPSGNASVPAGNIFFKDTFDEPIHNMMNQWSTTDPQTYLLLSANQSNRERLEQVYDAYDKANDILSPLLALMVRMIENGETITNTGAAIDRVVYLTSGNPNNFSSPIAFTAPVGPSMYINARPKRYLQQVQDQTIIATLTGGAAVFNFPIPAINSMVRIGDVIQYNAIDINTYPIAESHIPIVIQSGASITNADLEAMQKVLRTGELIVGFQRQLFGPLNDLAKLTFDSQVSWDKPTELLQPLYTKRLLKKNITLESLRILRSIESTVISQLPDIDIPPRMMPGSTTPPTLLESDIKAVTELDPSAADFNASMDKYWIFTRYFMLNWYAIFGHILTSIILSNTASTIRTIIRLLDSRFTALTLDGYSPQIASIDALAALTRTEINKKRASIDKELDAYPHSIDKGPNDIIPTVTDNLAFDLYHSNIGSPSTEVYCIIAMIKPKSLAIKTALEAVRDTTDKMVLAVSKMDAVLEPEYVRTLKERTQPASETMEAYKTAIRNFIADVGSNLNVALDAANLPTSSFIRYRAGLTAHVEKLFEEGPTGAKIDTFKHNGLLYLKPNISNFDIKFMKAFDKIPEQEYEQVYHLLPDATNYTMFQLLILGQLYTNAFVQTRNALRGWFNEINGQLASTHVTDLQEFSQVFYSYLNPKRIRRTITLKTFSTITIPDNTAKDQIRFILFDGAQYKANTPAITDIHLTLQKIADYAKPEMAALYRAETSSYQSLLNLDYSTRQNLTTQKAELQQRAISLNLVLQVINLVMFNEYYTKFAFVNNTTLMQYLEQCISNYERARIMVRTKLLDMTTKNNKHVMAVSQINNYIAFSSAIDKLINGEAIVKKFYKRMSFGLVEYYLDVLRTVIQRIDGKRIEDMSPIESYLYRYHYIQLHRCYSLFLWIRNDFLPDHQRADEANRRANIPFESILRYKIEPLKTLGDVNRVFIEFQGLRTYLDDYSAVEMDKVQLHLRINDYANKGYNDSLEALADATGRPTNFMMDYAPDSEPYSKLWDTGKLLFTNPNNGNVLRVNFSLLEQIYTYDNPGQTRPFDEYYSDVYKKMQNLNSGIKFKRIYNTQVYPDSDVISNYMSIAPNILNGKGTVIMTYGYSGTGKSASLFGRPAEPSRGIMSPSNGILQATLSQFPSVEIYFRVYEIYGLGVPYNYYWNPETEDLPDCYPRFSQAVIHHVVDASNPDALNTVDQLVFTNRHDMLSYVMDFANPAPTDANPSNFIVQDADTANMGGKRGFTHYFDDATKRLKGSTFVKIDKGHYDNFNVFVDEIDKARRKGVTIRNLLSHVAKQIKGTINNRESSRSILVYDFEIRDLLVPDSPFVPFVIYDLPGKEDIYRTYITTNETTKTLPEDKANAFRDIKDDVSRERKSTYATNPLLIPIFDDNAEVMMGILTQLSNAGPGYTNAGDPAKLNADYEARIVRNIVDYEVQNFAFRDTKINGYAYEDNMVKYTIGKLFVDDGVGIDTFVALYDPSNYNPAVRVANAYFDLAVQRGIPGVFPSQSSPADVVNRELRVVISVVVIAFLLKYRLFDVVVEIINVIMNPPSGSDVNTDGGWSRSKIYAFYEAYYINENVVGLLQYLITEILEKPSSKIKVQYSAKDTMSMTINKNWKTANRYRVARNQYAANPSGKIGLNYGMFVNKDLLEIDKTDPLNEKDITDFVSANDVQPGGMFANDQTPVVDVIERMANVIAFENKGKYNSNDIFRSGTIECSVDDANRLIINPKNAVTASALKLLPEHNSPLLQDFIEPYEQKISFYYVFYVVSNSQTQTKAEEQVKLLNNSMPFINEMDS